MQKKAAEIPSKKVHRDLSDLFENKSSLAQKVGHLMFMIRENQDVFEQFVKKLPMLAIENKAFFLAETVVHLMFNDLTSPDQMKKLSYVAYKVAHATYDSEDNAVVALLQQFKKEFFL